MSGGCLEFLRKSLRESDLAKEPSRTSAQPGGDLARCLGKIDGWSPAPAVGTVGQNLTGPGRRLFPHRIDSEGIGDDLEVVALGGASGGDVERGARVSYRPACRVGGVGNPAAGEVSGQR